LSITITKTYLLARAFITAVAEASLAEVAAFEHDRAELHQAIAAEADPARRAALLLRSEIMHADHIAEAYAVLATLVRATGGDGGADHEYQELTARYRQQAAEARQAWAERAKDRPDLYPPNPRHRWRRDGEPECQSGFRSG